MNESVDLFEGQRSRRQVAGEGDPIAALGDRVERLVERFGATRRAVDELRQSVADRDRRIVELDARLASFERSRRDLLTRIDALVRQVDGLVAERVETRR